MNWSVTQGCIMIITITVIGKVSVYPRGQCDVSESSWVNIYYPYKTHKNRPGVIFGASSSNCWAHGAHDHRFFYLLLEVTCLLLISLLMSGGGNKSELFIFHCNSYRRVGVKTSTWSLSVVAPPPKNTTGLTVVEIRPWFPPVLCWCFTGLYRREW